MIAKAIIPCYGYHLSDTFREEKIRMHAMSREEKACAAQNKHHPCEEPEPVWNVLATHLAGDAMSPYLYQHAYEQDGEHQR